jgi:hypothetical protein
MTDYYDIFIHEAAHGYIAMQHGATFAKIQKEGDIWSAENDVCTDESEQSLIGLLKTFIAGPVADSITSGKGWKCLVTDVRSCGVKGMAIGSQSYRDDSMPDWQWIDYIYSGAKHVLPELTDIIKEVGEEVEPLIKQARGSAVRELGRRVANGSPVTFRSFDDIAKALRGEQWGAAAEMSSKYVAIAKARQQIARAERALSI